MSYKLTIVQNPAYLHAIVTGTNTEENVARYLEDILRECRNRGCPKILIEERLDGPRLDTFGVFQIASEMSTRAPSLFAAVAYVDVHAKNHDNMKFAETVAVNRGLPVRVFGSVRDAEQWLLSTDRTDS